MHAATETFESMGIDARREDHGWAVTLPRDESVSHLITQLVDSGLSIERVEEQEATLEELYDQFTEVEQ